MPNHSVQMLQCNLCNATDEYCTLMCNPLYLTDFGDIMDECMVGDTPREVQKVQKISTKITMYFYCLYFLIRSIGLSPNR